jgi:uncharacterized phage-associated protein
MEVGVMKAFCEECRDYVTYRVETIDRTKEIKGRTVKFCERVAYCNTCKSETFVSSLRDQNLSALDAAYRAAEDLISADEIKGILEKYDIGKRPLSLLLGWGETTLTRFVSGDLPSKTYSDQLRRINSVPEDYLEILITKKERITEAAYEKSLVATNHELTKTAPCLVSSKIESAANYIISRSLEITPFALQKLLYFSQGFHKIFMGSFIFEEDCEAWVHGPVYRDIYFKYKDHGYNPIEDLNARFECFDLSESEREVIDAVISYFGCYSGKILEAMTHMELPWREARVGLVENEGSEMIIQKDRIETYFNQVYQKYKMLNIIDIKDYSGDIFEKIR